MTTVDSVYLNNPYARPVSGPAVAAHREPLISKSGVNRKLYGWVMAIAVLTLLIILLCEAANVPSKKQMERLRSGNASLVTEIAVLQAELNELTDISHIGSRATELGMEIPSKETEIHLTALNPRIAQP